MNESSLSFPPYIPENPFIVKDSYFRAHLEGNQYFPQKMRVIRLYVACSVITDPPADFQALRTSSLSQEQVDELAAEMNASHDANRIMKFSEGSRELEEMGARPSMVVRLERLPQLWESDIDGVLRMIHQKVAGGPPLPQSEDVNTGLVTHLSADAVEEINNYWQDPKKQIEIRLMQESARLIQAILHEDDGRFVRMVSYLRQAALNHEKLERGILGLYLDPHSRKLLAEVYGTEGSFNSQTFTRFWEDIQSLNNTPTRQTAQHDVIFKLLKNAIQMEVKKAKLPMPFGLEYADAA